MVRAGNTAARLRADLVGSTALQCAFCPCTEICRTRLSPAWCAGERSSLQRQLRRRIALKERRVGIELDLSREPCPERFDIGRVAFFAGRKRPEHVKFRHRDKT